MVAFRDAFLVLGRRRDREADLDFAAVGDAQDVEAGVAEDLHHRLVVVQHLGNELLDPGLGGARGELLEEARADPALLEAVVDGECDLGEVGVAQAHPVRERHGAAVERADECAAFVPVGFEHRLDELRPERGEAVETEVAAAVGEVREEREQSVGVLGPRCAQPQRRAVAEDDVGSVCRRDRDAAHAAASC